MSKGKKKLKDTAVGKFLAGAGSNMIGSLGDVLPDKGVFGLVKNLIKKDPELPDFYDEVVAKLINNDFVWAAENKTEIVGEWKKRYDGKSEPKK